MCKNRKPHKELLVRHLPVSQREMLLLISFYPFLTFSMKSSYEFMSEQTSKNRNWKSINKEPQMIKNPRDTQTASRFVFKFLI